MNLLWHLKQCDRGDLGATAAFTAFMAALIYMPMWLPAVARWLA